MTQKLDRIHHIAINVSDIKRAVEWYQTSFSCEAVYLDSRQALLKFENADLLLTLPSQSPPHVAYYRDDASAYGELHRQADGFLETAIADNTGNMVKLVCRSPLAES